jgi:hypothetical protein
MGNTFVCEGAVPSPDEFSVAIFNQPVTANWLQDTLGNPLTNPKVYTQRQLELKEAGMQQAYGNDEQPAGYYPGMKTDGDPLTGKMAWTCYNITSDNLV